jgi:hypothetical protein
MGVLLDPPLVVGMLPDMPKGSSIKNGYSEHIIPFCAIEHPGTDSPAGG